MLHDFTKYIENIQTMYENETKTKRQLNKYYTKIKQKPYDNQTEMPENQTKIIYKNA